MASMTESELKLLLNEKLCDIADALLLYYDCCQIKPGKDEKSYTCRDGYPNQCNSCMGTRFSGPNQVCPFQYSHMCHFRNIECRAWVCSTVKEQVDSKCITGLKMLEDIAKLYGIMK